MHKMKWERLHESKQQRGMVFRVAEAEASHEIESPRAVLHVVVICYLYFTRVLVYSWESAVSYQYFWTIVVAGKLGTLAFYAFSGLKFQPKANNLNFMIDDDDEKAAVAKAQKLVVVQ
nr:hypothetical protein CFP56_50655 [Quercus suber]